MLNSKLRMRFLKKIAQLSDSTTETETEETTPENETVKDKLESVNPPESFIISQKNTSLRIAFPAPIVALIDSLSDNLNTFLHYISLGKYNMKTLLTSPSTEATDIASRDFRTLFVFSKKFFEIMNKKYSKPLDKEEYLNLISSLREDSNLNNFSTATIAPEIMSKIQVSNMKSFIIGILDTLKNMSPSQ
jgi:hypothetical protein